MNVIRSWVSTVGIRLRYEISISKPSFDEPSIWYPIAVTICWPILDSISTTIAISIADGIGEGNPIMASTLEAGPEVFFAIKIVSTIAIWFLYSIADRDGCRHVESIPGWRVWAGSIAAIGGFHAIANILVAAGVLPAIWI